jgi:hypothetical protein
MRVRIDEAIAARDASPGFAKLCEISLEWQRRTPWREDVPAFIALSPERLVGMDGPRRITPSYARI